MGLGDKMFKGMAWSAVERVSTQAAQFVIQIVLARLLTPEEYGTVGILSVFIAISLVFIDSGFTKALIQKKDRTEDDISTVFIFNIAISAVAYLILFLLAPVVSSFYDIPQLNPLLKVLALSLVINALFTIPITLRTIKMDFKTLAKINFISAIVSGSIAIYLAYQGFGVWALVAQTLIKSGTTAVLIWSMVKWKPTWVFSKSSFKELFSFGSNLLVSSLLSVTVNKSYELVIAKLSSTKDLGYYTRGTQFTDVIHGMMVTVLHNVLLPGLTEVQDQIEVLTKHTKQIIKATAVVVVPIYLLLSIISEPLIRFLLTDKWLPAAIIMQIFCIARMISIISGINVNLLYVIGRSDLALKQQYLKLAIRVIFLIAALKFGIVYIALAELLSTTVHFFINTYHPGKIMNYGALKQIREISPTLLAGIIACLLAYGALYFIDSPFWQILVACTVSAPIYLGLLRLFKVRELDLLITKTKNLIQRKK